jgi:hypothetical protein
MRVEGAVTEIKPGSIDWDVLYSTGLYYQRMMLLFLLPMMTPKRASHVQLPLHHQIGIGLAVILMKSAPD